MKKKHILIDAVGANSWIGGVYYKKNIVFSLLQNEWVRNNAVLHVVTNPEYAHLFESFSDSIRIHTITYAKLRQRKIKLFVRALIYRCKYSFPTVHQKGCKAFGITGINWTPDYQHYHYKDNFPEQEYDTRIAIDAEYAESDFPLVLSSKSCLDDFRKYCSQDKDNVYVIPFVSYIEPEIKGIDDAFVDSVCERMGIKNHSYILVSNQFWKHKNHIVVLKALEQLIKRDICDIRVVFTGRITDYRNQDYIAQIKELLNDESIKQCSVCPGFIDREEQLALMRGAKFIIQPSLFEGWGTVLEDAKVLDKTVLLSDIPVHREQMNDKCILFDPYNADELADRICEMWNKEYVDDIQAGISGMYDRAKAYSEVFEKLLKEN